MTALPREMDNLLIIAEDLDNPVSKVFRIGQKLSKDVDNTQNQEENIPS